MEPWKDIYRSIFDFYGYTEGSLINHNCAKSRSWMTLWEVWTSVLTPRKRINQGWRRCPQWPDKSSIGGHVLSERCGEGSSVFLAGMLTLWCLKIFRWIVSFPSELNQWSHSTHPSILVPRCSSEPRTKRNSPPYDSLSLPANPQYRVNRLVIRDPSTLSKGETDAESPSTDVKNPGYDGVLVHLVCDMEAHCDWVPVYARLGLNVREGLFERTRLFKSGSSGGRDGW